MWRETVILLFVGLTASCAIAEEQVTRCDRLVSHPSDPDRVAEGVSSSDVDHSEAIAACETAVAKSPDNARLNYQLGRVYFYAGQPAKALPRLQFAAEKQYRQAQFVLGYVLVNGLQEVPVDLCRAEQLWADSALRGRLASQVSYAHYAMRAKFGSCPLSVNPEGQLALLKAASARELDYYQRLLVTELLDEWQQMYGSD